MKTKKQKIDTNDQPKLCIACGAEIEYLADFPGPRCLKCHAERVDREPLQKPDFIGSINI